MLQHHAEDLAGGTRRRDELRAPRAGQLQRLLDEHMLAGLETAPRDVEMAGGRGQHDRRLDRRIGQHGLDVGRCREGEVAGIGRGALGGAADGEADIRTLGEVEQALRMRQLAGPSPMIARPMRRVMRRSVRVWSRA